jgi:hypothetical protein
MSTQLKQGAWSTASKPWSQPLADLGKPCAFAVLALIAAAAPGLVEDMATERIFFEGYWYAICLTSLWLLTARFGTAWVVAVAKSLPLFTAIWNVASCGAATPTVPKIGAWCWSR